MHKYSSSSGQAAPSGGSTSNFTYSSDSISSSYSFHNIYDTRPHHPNTFREDALTPKQMEVKIPKGIALDWISLLFKYFFLGLLLPFTFLLYILPKVLFPVLDIIPKSLKTATVYIKWIYSHLNKYPVILLAHPKKIVLALRSKGISVFSTLRFFLKKIYEYLFGTFYKKWEKFQGITLKIGKLVWKIWEKLELSFLNFFSRLNNLKKVCVTAIQSFSQLFLSLRDRCTSWKNSIKVAANVVGKLFISLGNFLMEGIQTTQRLFKHIQILGKIFSSLKRFIIEKRDSFGLALKRLMQPIAKFLKIISTPVVFLVNSIKNQTLKIKKKVSEGFTVIERVTLAIVGWMAKKLVPVFSFLQKMYIRLNSVYKKLSSYLKNLFSPLLQNIVSILPKPKAVHVKQTGFIFSPFLRYWPFLKKGLLRFHYFLDLLLLSLYEIPKQFVYLIIEWFREVLQFPILRRFWN